MNFEQLQNKLSQKGKEVAITEALKEKASSGSFMDKLKYGVNVVKNATPVSKKDHNETAVALESKIEGVNALLQTQIDELKAVSKADFTPKEDIEAFVEDEINKIFDNEVLEAMGALNVDGKTLKEHYAHAIQASKEKGEQMANALKERNVKEYVSFKKAKETSDASLDKLKSLVSDIKDKFKKKQKEEAQESSVEMTEEEFLAAVQKAEEQAELKLKEETEKVSSLEKEKEKALAKEAELKKVKEQLQKQIQEEKSKIFEEFDVPSEMEDAFDEEEEEEEAPTQKFSLKRSKTKVSKDAENYKITEMGDL